MTSLTEKLSEIAGAAFAACGLPPEFGLVRVSDRPDLAQFQCNGAMAAAKAAKKNPREVAGEIVAKLKERPEFFQIEIAGPGFINLNVTDGCLAAHLAETADDRLGAARAGDGTVILDYGGPNVAKPMHVGHLRASIIGESLRRIFLFAGYRALGDIHLGDWGTQMGMIISELEIRHPGWPYFDKGFSGPYPGDSPVSLEQLEDIYPAAAAACKADAARMEKARQATVELQNGRPGYRALWKHFIAVSLDSVRRNMKALGVQFDLWLGESDAHPAIAPMVEKLKAARLAVEDQGALIVPVAQDGDVKEMPPLILYKSDGAVMYGTTDLATIADRMRDYAPEKIVYVTDQRQSLHFEQVFRAARKAGIAPDGTALVHAGFGTMNGPDGKPFKTRDGGVLKLEDLIGMGVEKARQRLAEADLGKDMDDAEKESIAHKVAIAAIKFADLQNQRQSDYIFDLGRMTAFEGKTGPYILYQAVRIKSLMDRAGGCAGAAQDFRPVPTRFVLTDVDRPLALLLTGFPDVFAAALSACMPNHLCDYAYRLAQQFSSFYGNCHILSEQDAALRDSRLGLCALTFRQLEKCLDLLGIEIPERM